MNIAGFGQNRGQPGGSDNNNQGAASFFKKIGSGSYLCILISLIGLFVFPSHLVLIPSRVLHNFEIWRTFSFAFAVPNFLSFLFQLLFLYVWAFPYEVERGTLNLLPRIVVLSVFTSIFDLLFYLILTLIWPSQAVRLVGMGLFRLFFVELCARCFKNPSQLTQIICFPTPFPQIYIIPVFLLFDLILNQFYLGNIPCVLAGYILMKYCSDLECFQLSERSLRKYEKKLLFLDNIGTFYTLNRKGVLASEIQNEANRTYEFPEAEVGGKAMTESERRNAWVNKFQSNDLQTDIEIKIDTPEKPSKQEKDQNNIDLI